MSNALLDFAKSEFIRAGWCNADGKFEDEMQELICRCVTDLLSVFSEQGHSGFSGGYAIRLFEKLVKFSPISPLTGDDDEWVMHSETSYQNKHCGSVFKNGKNEKAYWLDHYVFRDESGCTFTSGMSRQYIEFPWVEPESIIVDVTTDAGGNTVYPNHIKQIS